MLGRMRMLKELEPDYPLLWVFVAAGTMVSGWATFQGLLAFQGQNAAFALIFTLLVQAGIIFFARRLGMATGMLRRAPFVMALMLLWLFSSGMAYAYWWQVFRAENYAREQFGQSVEDLVRPLQAFEQGFVALSDELRQLADYSHATAQRERTHGGTCGDGSRRGPGPRQRLRDEDARIFAAHAKWFGRQAASLSEMVQRLEQAVKTFAPARRAEVLAQVRKAHRQALAISNSAEMQLLLRDLESQLRKHKEGFRDRRGQLVRCVDPVLERGIARLREHIRTLPKLPERMITAFGANHRDSVLRIYEELFRLLGFSDKAPTFQLQDVALPLSFAIIPDVIILLASIAMVRAELRLRTGPGSPLGPAPVMPRLHRATRTTVRQVDQALQRADERAAALLRKAKVRMSSRRAQLIVPENPPQDNAEAVELLRLAELMEASGVLRLERAQYPVAWLRRRVREQLRDLLQGVRTVCIYAMPPLLPVQFNLAAMEAEMPDVPPQAGGDGRAALPGTETPPEQASDTSQPSDATQSSDDRTPSASDEDAPAPQPRAKARRRVVLVADENGHFYADVRFNRTVVARTLVDTGATNVALPWELAEELGLEPENLRFNVKVNTANGEAKAALVVLREVCIEGLCLRNVVATVAPRGRLDEPLLGMSFLQRLRGVQVRNGEMELLG